MALKSPYLAAEGPAARRSRALHRFTVASPLVILLAVGMVGHTRRAPYPQPSGMAEYDQKVLAYRERVGAVRALTGDDEKASAAALKAEAKRWVAGYESGLLKPLKPAYFEDHLQNGPRGEVVRAALTLATLLSSEATLDVERGKADEAARTALLAARVARGVRDFEVQGLLQSLLVQRRATTVLGDAWPKVSRREKVAIAPALRRLRVDVTDVESLRQQDIAQTDEYQRRQGLEVTRETLADDPDETAIQQEHTLKRSVRLSNDRIDGLLKSSD